MHMVKAQSLLMVVAMAAGAVTGCESITGLNHLSVGSASDDAAVNDAGSDASTGGDEATEDAADDVITDDAACINHSAWAGRGCFSCKPTELAELRNACTTATCTPFDNVARIPGYGADAARSPKVVPMPDAGAAAATSDAGAAAATSDAGAAPPSSDAGAPPGHVLCSTLLPRPVYLYGSTALAIGLRTLAQSIAGTATLVYQSDSSCLGLDAINTGTTRLKGSAQYWPVGQAQPALCDIENEQPADVGLCDVSPESCIDGFSGSDNLVNDTGAAQVFMFTVPNGSSQKAISAEAAYAVFGFDDGGVLPWVDPQSLMRRGPGSGNQLTIASSLGLAPAYWRGVIKAKSSEVKPALLALSDPEKGLGITSADVADEMDSRANLRTLAYQHYGQNCAFTPDSTSGSSDKRNVRDGHYELWAPLHFYTRGSGGHTQDRFIGEIVSFLTGAKPLPNRNTDLITTLKQAGLIPTCAMHVTRAKEGARIVPFQPSPSCSCYYDASPPGGVVPADCKPCTTSAECPDSAQNCSFGYCEP
jgi:hypothetical protein